MKNVLFAIYGLISFFFLCGCSCKKEVNGPSPTLPPITQVGANTFGCKMDGKIWVPYWPCAQFGAGSVELNYAIEPINKNQILPLHFYLGAGSRTDNTIFLITDGYTLSDHIYRTGNIYDSVLIHFFGQGGIDYSNADPLAGHESDRYFEITKLDTVNNIVSGIFSFTLYGGNGDSVVVRDGRFDLRIGSYARCTQ